MKLPARLAVLVALAASVAELALAAAVAVQRPAAVGDISQFIDKRQGRALCPWGTSTVTPVLAEVAETLAPTCSTKAFTNAVLDLSAARHSTVDVD